MHVESLKKIGGEMLGCHGGCQSSFDHVHAESLKNILSEILVCHIGGINHPLTMHMCESLNEILVCHIRGSMIF